MVEPVKNINKFDWQKILNDVKAIISPTVIPEANKDDAIGYCISELSKLAKDMAEYNAKQTDTIGKISVLLDNLYREVMKTRQSNHAIPVTEVKEDAKTT